MDIPAMRQELKEEFEREAEWRRQKAAEYPDDKRNLDSAAGYDRLAATVGDVSDELMVAYVECFRHGGGVRGVGRRDRGGWNYAQAVAAAAPASAWQPQLPRLS